MNDDNLLSSNAAVVVAGFCRNKMPSFPLPVIHTILVNIFSCKLNLSFFSQISYFRTKLATEMLEMVGNELKNLDPQECEPGPPRVVRLLGAQSM